MSAKETEDVHTAKQVLTVRKNEMASMLTCVKEPEPHVRAFPRPVLSPSGDFVSTKGKSLRALRVSAAETALGLAP